MPRLASLVIVLALGALAPPAPAAPPEIPATTVGVSGSVHATARSGDTLFVGGQFGLAGPNVAGIAAVNTTTGALGRTMPSADGQIFATAPDGAGGVYIGGDFGLVGGVSRLRLAHILADGSVDPDWDPRANNQVNDLLFDNGVLYVGGQFTCLGGDGDNTCGGGSEPAGETFRRRLAGIEPDGDVIPFNPGPNDTVLELAAAPGAGDNSIFVGGDFTCIGGDGDDNCGEAGEIQRLAIARMTATATGATVSNTWAPVVRGGFGAPRVNAIAVTSTTVYVGGDFVCVEQTGGSFNCNGADGVNRQNAAAFALSDADLQDWNPALDVAAFDFFVSGSTVFMTGAFDCTGGDADDTCGGAGESADERERNGLASVPTTGDAQPANTFDPKLGGFNPVSSLAIVGSKVYAGGSFACVGTDGDSPCGGPGEPAAEVRRFGAAAFNATTGAVDASWAPSVEAGPFELIAGATEVLMFGEFRLVNAVERGNLAAIDLTTGDLLPLNLKLNAPVTDLTLDGSSLYVGGSFTCTGFNIDSDCTDPGETVRNRIARFSTAGALDPWDPSANAIVEDMVLDGGTLYLGGDFTCLGGDADATCTGAGEPAGETIRRRLAAVSTSTGAPLAWNPVANDAVVTLLRSGDTMFAGGDFTCLGGNGDATCSGAGEAVRRRIGAVSTTSGAVQPFNPSANAGVSALALDGTTLYSGGLFTCVGGDGDATCGGAGEPASEAPRSHLAAYDVTATGAPLGWNPVANDRVRGLAVAGGKIYAGGDFICFGGDGDGTCGGATESADERVRRRLAALDPVTGVPDGWAPRPNGDVTVVETDGNTLFVGGGFTFFSDKVQRGIGVFSGVGFPPPPPPPPPEPEPEPSPASPEQPADPGTPQQPGPGPDTSAPGLSGASISPARFRARAGTSLNATLSEAATLAVTIARRVPGRRVGRRCVPGARKGKRCTVVKRRRLSLNAAAGANRLRLRTAGLAPGRYTLTVVASDAAGNASAPVTLRFTILAPRR